MLPRLNKQLIPEIASLRNLEADSNTPTLVCKKSVTDNAREATAATTALCDVGASVNSTALTGTAACSGPQSLEIMDLSWARIDDRIVLHKQLPNRQT